MAPIRKTIVRVKRNNTIHAFRLDYRFSQQFLANPSLASINKDFPFLGDMVVSKMGLRKTYVSINTAVQRDLAIEAVRGFLNHAQMTGEFRQELFLEANDI